MSNNMEINGSMDDVQALLPWYLNGTLSAEDKALVERELQTSPDLRDELALLQRLQAAVVQDNEAIEPPPAADFDRLMAQIEAEDRTQQIVAQQKREAFWDRLRNLFPFAEPVLRAVPTLAAVLIVAQAAVIFGMITLGGPDAVHETATGGVELPKTTVLVMFDEQARLADIQAVLADLDGNIVKGPTDQGVYVVEVRRAFATPKELDQQLADIRARWDIVQMLEKGL